MINTLGQPLRTVINSTQTTRTLVMLTIYFGLVVTGSLIVTAKFGSAEDVSSNVKVTIIWIRGENTRKFANTIRTSRGVLCLITTTVIVAAALCRITTQNAKEKGKRR